MGHLQGNPSGKDTTRKEWSYCCFYVRLYDCRTISDVFLWKLRCRMSCQKMRIEMRWELENVGIKTKGRHTCTHNEESQRLQEKHQGIRREWESGEDEEMERKGAQQQQATELMIIIIRSLFLLPSSPTLFFRSLRVTAFSLFPLLCCPDQSFRPGGTNTHAVSEWHIFSHCCCSTKTCAPRFYCCSECNEGQTYAQHTHRGLKVRVQFFLFFSQKR